MTPLELVKKACVNANPEIVDEHTIDCDMDESHGYVCSHSSCPTRRIRLADVLYAIRINKPSAITNVHVEISGDFCVRKSGEEHYTCMVQWDLLHDSLDAQNPATIEFLSTLLA